MAFVAGQPLGLHASWPLFALEHHLVVWYAADQYYPGKKFTKYVILGDDIVIADERVAQDGKRESVCMYRYQLGNP